MGILGWVELADELEQIVQDAEADEQTPAGQKLIADIKTLITKVRTNTPPVSVTTTTTTATNTPPQTATGGIK